MKKLISRKKIPHLGRYTDISEFLLQQGDGSASESEPELETNQVKVSSREKMCLYAMTFFKLCELCRLICHKM